MFAKVSTAGLLGINGFFAEVEADVQSGLPGFYLTGALSSETREAQFRVQNALKNSGIRLEPRKITVNFSPASIRKEGTAYDLAIAAAVLCAFGFLDQEQIRDTGFFGELGLDGSVKRIRGALPLAFTLKECGIRRIILPAANVHEAELAEELEIVGCGSIKDVIDAVAGVKGLSPCAGSRERNSSATLDDPVYSVDFSEVHGQLFLRRAAEIAVSGRHNLLMSGPAGTGKTMIAKRMPTIMPELTRRENIEISKVYSICGLLPEDRPLFSRRPFRSPHHGISDTAFAGGGANVMPGEISLASGGILFLDEMPLFSRSVLEMLRQPLEEGKITITRMKGSCTYPADIMLVAAMNNCACGYYPDLEKCTCTRAQIKAYMGRISRPLLERIDICAQASPVSYAELTDLSEAESSEDIRKRVVRAYEIQTRRFRDNETIKYNSRMGIREIERFCSLRKEEEDFIRGIYKRKGLSGRTYHKILKVSRTIADMDGSEAITKKHLAEAVELRSIEDALFGDKAKIHSAGGRNYG